MTTTEKRKVFMGGVGRLVEDRRPFVDHTAPRNDCRDGRAIVRSCLEKGLGIDGAAVDCVGLVVAGLEAVVPFDPRQWPLDYRHPIQLQKGALAASVEPQWGDPMLLYYDDPFHDDPNSEPPTGLHMGIFIGGSTMIDASSGGSRRVSEKRIAPAYWQQRVVPLGFMLELAQDAALRSTPVGQST
jgi:hypothetical protein